MDQTKKYAAVLPKIGVEKSELLSAIKLKTLLDCKNLSEFTIHLGDTTYQEQISKLSPPLTVQKLERSFNENLLKTYLNLLNNLPKSVKPFIELYLKRFEIEHIKILIKATMAKMTSKEKISKIYLPVETYFNNNAVIEEAVKASTITSVIQAFQKTEYATSLNAGLKKYNENGSTIQFNLLLDRQYFDNFYCVYEKLPKEEQQHAKFYASMTIDGFLLFTVLRGKLLGYDSNWLKDALPPNYFNITTRTFDNLVYAPDYDETLKIIKTTPYKTYFTSANTPELVSIAEKAFKEAVLHHAKSRALLDVFNIGAALSFITLKEADIYNLNLLALSIDASLKPEEIKNKLLT